LNKKIREGQLAQYNFILVVGSAEEENESVNIRTRDNKIHGTKSLAETVEMFRGHEREYTRDV
jgi:threonyl-tRNA synthetase